MEWVLGGVILLVVMFLLVRKTLTSYSPKQLLRFLPQYTRFRIFIGVPLEEPARWSKLTGADARRKLISLGKQSISLVQVRAFLVATKSGEVIAALRPFAPLPKGLHTDDNHPVTARAGHSVSQFTSGQQQVRVSFSRDPERTFCAIHLHNTTAEHITVVSYGCYQPDGERYTLATATGQFFSNDDFLSVVPPHE